MKKYIYRRLSTFVLGTAIGAVTVFGRAEEPIQISGVYPHLRMWNSGNECGTGAVVLWQGDLWSVTYSPHSPAGSSDKLYQITPELEQLIYEGSVGGTPANRMIHRETNQLLIGPYLIDAEKQIRVLDPSVMFGRLTANARHLTKPESMIYYATMEEGLYEVDLNTLEVNCLIRDGNDGAPEEGIVSSLPGYHGKGMYSSQDLLVYSNNGEHSPEARRDPTTPSGALAQLGGEGDWQLVRRNQFTEVTGPGGIHGNDNPDSDPIWAMGWDARSLLLALLEGGEWYYYRLPKGSHSYDGSHGWNTEWPRIREIGEKDLLATMHGTFWRFPATFSRSNSAGIAPRSNYLKVIGDFCRWNDRIVLGCDDSASAEFLNTRTFKAEHGAPQQSNSNFWFIDPAYLDEIGPAIGRGSVWLRDEIADGQPSDPYLFSGYDHRQLHLIHGGDEAVTFTLEVDREGTNDWEELRSLTVAPGEATSHVFSVEETGAWVRLSADRDAVGVTANFQYRNEDSRSMENADLFTGFAAAGEEPETNGLMRSLSYNRLGLATKDGGYELSTEMKLTPVEDSTFGPGLIDAVSQPDNAFIVDSASILIEEDGQRYRLPKNDAYIDTTAAPEALTFEEHVQKNLAIGADVSASSTHDTNVPANVVDGDLTDGGRWVGNNEGSTWFELDLGKPETFRSLWLVSGWGGRTSHAIRDFDLQIRDGDEWKTLPGGAIRDNRTIRREILLDEPVEAQHVRMISEDEGFVRVFELAIFEEPLEFGTRYANVRICREVATERDLLNVHGTFYELPARNAQGLAKVRPIATHNLNIHDFCSHNGLLLFTGLDTMSETEHIFRSDDGKAAVWAGVVDDLWKLGKPRGTGGPWANTRVAAGVPSDPYLMTAYDKKSVEVSSSEAATIRLEVDVDGTGLWIPHRTIAVEAGGSASYEFPEGFSAYWVRAVSDVDTKATVQFTYE